MIEKNVRCPKCHEIVTISGESGVILSVICPKCGSHGKVTFKKPSMSNKVNFSS